jgi:hypothetical protein
MAHAKWYQKPKFKQPFPQETLGDGSTAQAVAINDTTLLILRQWPNGNTDRVRRVENDKGVPHYEVAKRDRFGQAVAFIGDPDWHPPYVRSNIVPGTSPSSIETFDLGTGMDHTSRKKLDEYYDEHNLAIYNKAELLNMHEKTPPKASRETIRGQFRGSMPLAPEGARRSVIKADLTKVE